jgi:hypothetical protein
MPCQYSSFSILLVCNDEFANIDGALRPPNFIFWQRTTQMVFWILGMMCVNLEKTVDCFRKNGAMEDGKDALLKKRNAG